MDMFEMRTTFTKWKIKMVMRKLKIVSFNKHSYRFEEQDNFRYCENFCQFTNTETQICTSCPCCINVAASRYFKMYEIAEAT